MNKNKKKVATKIKAKATAKAAATPAAKKKSNVPQSVVKYKEALDLYKYYKLKQKVKVVPFTSGDETKMMKAERKMKKYKKLAIPELVKMQRKKLASRGKGKKRGGAGGMLSKQ